MNSRVSLLLVTAGGLLLSACSDSSGGGNSPTQENRAPVANAGTDQVVGESSAVGLDASNSSDADGDKITYSWTQSGGTAVTLSDSTSATPTFTAPAVDADIDLAFALTVSDGELSDTDNVTITVNAAPTANAGEDFSIMEGNAVTLDASASTDPSDTLTYSWSQTGGPAVTLDDAASATPGFIAPDVVETTPLEFELTVSDGIQETTDTVGVTVDGAILTVSIPAMKTLRFDWPAMDAAHHFRLQHNPDGVSGFTTMIDDIMPDVLAHEMEIASHLIEWSGAVYLLEACADADCTSVVGSSEGRSTRVAALDAIGYFKASGVNQDDQFGETIAISGDGNTLVVGARLNDGVGLNSGTVYVFRKEEDGWRQQDFLRPASGEAGDQFGISVAVSRDGNTIAVGAHGEDSNATDIDGDESNNDASAAGAVYLYRFDTVRGWAQAAYIKAPNTHAADFFGWRVALNGDGNILAVGAPNEDGDENSEPGNYNINMTRAGAVYVFNHDGDAWQFSDYLKASNPDAEDKFGESLTMNNTGDVIVVGAMLEDGSATGVYGVKDDNTSNAGAAYVFRYDGLTWREEAYLKASNTGQDDLFGRTLSISGDGNTIAVGSGNEDGSGSGINPADDDDAATAGAVYVYRFDGLEWGLDAYVKLTEMDAGDFLAFSALNEDGSLLAIGATQEDGSTAGFEDPEADNNLINSGAVELLRRDADGWKSIRFIKARFPGNGDHFGNALSMDDSGDTLAVSAPTEDGGSAGVNPEHNDDKRDAGAVFVY